jgi:rfaE bifunctional protein nucleotidyltransferase chain/domain
MKGDAAPIFRSMAGLKRWLDANAGGRVVLGNGCFDPLHVGHIRYLQGARQAGDCLVVAVNDDESTRALKGSDRPIMPVGDRARLVAGLEMVDAVLIFSAADVSRILKKVRPQIHAKGTDYTRETVPERDISIALGIETVIVGDAKSHASSDVVRQLRTHGPAKR